MTTVAVIDYGMGNLRSVSKAVEHVAPRATVKITADAKEILSADRVIFPGQGAIVGCIAALEQGELRAAVTRALDEKPFLGLCLGLQALYEASEEGGGTACLSILPGTVKRFTPRDASLKVPHMGWNRVHQERSHPLWDGIGQDERFYFVHSYYADSADPKDAVGTTDYGLRFTSAAARDNIFAVQFHPEKSQRAGLRLLQNFVAWDGSRH
ncbi:MAG TPA: imidazole glycerol phosphate synthase subunit HisH [Burkholderiales bacterium]|nr:imidazole glycerol phosphate synthase subunit HisH [Burkholderiales bacterium]